MSRAFFGLRFEIFSVLTESVCFRDMSVLTSAELCFSPKIRFARVCQCLIAARMPPSESIRQYTTTHGAAQVTPQLLGIVRVVVVDLLLGGNHSTIVALQMS